MLLFSAAVAHAGVYPSTPWISPPTGAYNYAKLVVKIADSTSGVSIYYTTDGSAPSAKSALYTTPITIANSSTPTVVRAIAISSSSSSAFATVSYRLPAPAPSPVITPGSGSYSSLPTISITDSLSGANIYYTTDGTVPTIESALYKGALSLSSSASGTKVIQAIAVVPNLPYSAVASATLKLELPSGMIASTVVQPSLGLTIPTDFLGVSHEWNDGRTMIGSTSTGYNPLYPTLMGQLAKNMNGPVVIRIGGGTTDISGPATAATVLPFSQLASKLPSKFILGVNFEADNLALAEEQAKTFVANMPASALEAIEIGNEPDGYIGRGLRPPSYSFSEFLSAYQQWHAGILGVNSTLGISGPVFGMTTWEPDAETSLSNGSLQASIVTEHHYIQCYDAGDPAPDNFLLLPKYAGAGLWSMAPYAAIAHAANSRFRVGELNSICLGGQPGLSNSFSSALWAIDTMFEYADGGIDGVNWQTSYNGGNYDLFQFHLWNEKGLNAYSLTGVRPLFYGLLFFSRAAGNSARLLPTATITDSNVKVWATTDAKGNGHIVLINKEISASGTVQITAGGFSSGTVTRLSAPGGYLALDGVTFGGQTYDNSKDGTLQGSLVTEPVTPNGKVWTVHIQPSSAVLLDLNP